jgi:RNA polymerase sigma factor (sigma-70 family)
MATVISIASGNHRERVLARRNALAEEHLDLVASIAKAIACSLPACFDFEDLRSVGYLALLRAATNYDPVRHAGVPFSGYARPMIRGAIIDSVRRTNWRENTRPGLDDTDPPSYTPEFDAAIDEETQAKRVHVAINRLKPKIGRVVRQHYIDGKRLVDVARELEVCDSRVSQMARTGLLRLRMELSA